MRHMSLEQKVGQLFVIEVAGRDADNVSDAAKTVNQRLYGVDTPAQAIAKYQPGGVIYYTTRQACSGCPSDDNIGDPAQVATLSNGLQTASLAQPAHIPLQISVDQEGGALVARFGPPATQMPGAMALGADGSAEDARTSGDVIGTELKAVGVTQDYGVDSDVNINPNNPVIGVRSPGGDPALVSRIVTGEIKGFHDAGESAVSKHFPGHGDTGVDSHFGLPIVTHDLATFESTDLPPFKAAIAAGVDTIMTAHVVFPAVDPSGAPATMSHKILTGVLRDELGFKGLIVTDALDMAGATSTYPPNVAPVQAILAGADQLLVPPQMDTAYGAVLDAVRNGTISEQSDSTSRSTGSSCTSTSTASSRTRSSTPPSRRTVHGRARPPRRRAGDHRPHHDPGQERRRRCCRWPPAPATCSSRAGAWARRRRWRARSPRAAPPRRCSSPGPPPRRPRSTTPSRPRRMPTSWWSRPTTPMPSTRPPGSPRRPPPRRPGWCGRCWRPGSRSWSRRCATRTTSASFPEAPTVVDTYGYTADQVESLVRVLFGEVNPTGRLPVSIPRTDGTGDLFPFGHGLGY